MSTSNSNKEDLSALSQHPDYYIEGGDLFFLAERIQFRVHRYFFDRDSLYFRTQLEIPISAGGAAKGSNSSNAIVLPDVKASEFELFLWVFYNPTYSLYDKTVADWEVILRLAEKWTFAEVKNLAVRELEKLTFPDVDRIAIYQANSVDRHLLIPPYARLCEREESLKPPEGFRLGMETTLTIAHAREVARKGPTSSGARVCASGTELDAIVRKVFEIPAEASQTSAEKPKGGQENEGQQVNGATSGTRGGQSRQNASSNRGAHTRNHSHTTRT